MFEEILNELKGYLPPELEKLRSGNGRESEIAAIYLTSLFGIDDWIDREICRALTDRLLNGKRFPAYMYFWLHIAIIRRACGKSWDKAIAICGDYNPRTSKIMKFIDSVERAREKGLKTSRSGEPGEAFEEAAKVLGIKPSTARDLYYKLKRKGKVDARRLDRKFAYEILGLLLQEET